MIVVFRLNSVILYKFVTSDNSDALFTLLPHVTSVVIKYPSSPAYALDLSVWACVKFGNFVAPLNMFSDFVTESVVHIEETYTVSSEEH